MITTYKVDEKEDTCYRFVENELVEERNPNFKNKIGREAVVIKW
jgi:hypothetical protein